MTNTARRLHRVHFLAALLAGGVLGASLGITFALAQDRPPGSLDTECAGRCTANGYDAEFCGLVCWVPDAEVAARSYPLNWNCFSSCRERGGRAEDCMPACRQR